LIYFVDEDCDAMGAWISEVRLRGYQTAKLTSARQAFLELWNADPSDVQLVIVDVMLEPGSMAPDGQPNHTQGLTLLRDLSDQNPSVFPNRAVLFTASVGETRRKAAAFAEEMKIEIWDKSAYVSPIKFGDWIDRAVAERSNGAMP
jgi:CheY-like chemotaxis protein